MRTRKAFSLCDKNGSVRRTLYGTGISANQGLVELFDIHTKEPASGFYVKAVIALGESESVVETYEISTTATATAETASSL